MNSQTDRQLLTAYSERRSDVAFTELVRRHVDFVYSAALRMVRDSHLAEDVTQSVFTVVARDAHKLVHVQVLPGWLHRITQNLAANAVRSDVRRRAREQEAAVMNELLSANADLSRRSETEADANWEHIAPYLDEALGELSEPERDAVLLRYFKNQDLRTVGAALGISDDAAQKRVSRAVDRLREFMSKRGVTVGVSGLAIVISANAIQAAPVGLVVAISTAATLTTATVATTATITTTKVIAMTALQKTIVTATVAVLAGAGIYEARQASQLREQVQTFQQQEAPLAEQIQKLENQNAEKSTQLTSLSNQNQDGKNLNDLLRLRAEVARLRREAEDLTAAAKDAAAYQASVLDVLSNTPPVRTFVATSVASVPWNQTLVLGGWKTPTGKRAIVLATVEHGESSKSVSISSKVIEYTDAGGATLGFSKFNTDEALPTKTKTLNSEEVKELFRLAKNSEEIFLMEEQHVTTSSGDQARVQTGEMYQILSGEKYFLGPILHVVPTVSTDEESVQVVMTAQVNYRIPLPMP